MHDISERGFASDNNAGIDIRLLKTIEAANTGHVVAYGDDPYTRKAEVAFKKHFGPKAEVFFVLTGTGANVLSLSALMRSFHAVICAESAHIHVDECGAPEKFSNCKLLTVPSGNGKLTPESIRKHLKGFGFEHHVQPKVISISQPTELGTIYTTNEIRKISALAHRYKMYLHMDGARLANAAVSLGTDLRSITADCGVDVLSFGGTKNGMLFGESVVFFQPALARNFRYLRKQGMQLASKMRFIAAQFETYLEMDIWKSNALHANKMASLLAEKVRTIKNITITQEVQTNGVFALIPKELIGPLQEQYYFYVWDENTSEVRWMTSFDTQPSDIEDFVKLLREAMENSGK
jgi:threonine aldolase